MPCRRIRLLGTALLASAALAAPIAGAVPAAAALRAPACADAPPAAAPFAGTPWPQQRYAPQRIAPLATGDGVVVAVLDSGVDRGHPQLRGRVLAGADLLDGGDGSTDCVGHGTAVAGIIAAATAPGTGFTGLAPQARILPVRVSEQREVDGDTPGRRVDPAGLARAIRWAVDSDAGVLNLSLVLHRDEPAVRAAIAYAHSRDVVVVAVAGNRQQEGAPTPYPAAYDGVIGVGAIDETGARASFSQAGAYVDVVAPGVEVHATAPGGGHRVDSGTSFAAPFVAATAALVRQYHPGLTAAEVAARIIGTADPAPGAPRDGYGAGVLNPYRAVTETAQVRPAAQPEPVASVADTAVAAAQVRRAAATDRSWRVAAVGGGVAATLLLAAVVLPRGRRRRWRAGAARP